MSPSSALGAGKRHLGFLICSVSLDLQGGTEFALLVLAMEIIMSAKIILEGHTNLEMKFAFSMQVLLLERI